MKYTIKIITTLLFLAVSFVWSSVILVPQDYPTIQTGIDESNNGDTVLVSVGMYEESVNFRGKSILLASNFILSMNENDIIETIIKSMDFYSTVTFNSGEDSTSILQGFTITSDSLYSYSSGIRCDYASPKIINCIIENNHADFGGGISLRFSNAIIDKVFISDNSAFDEDPFSGNGGAVYIYNSNPIFRYASLVNNRAYYGPAVYSSSSNIIFINSLFINNDTMFITDVGTLNIGQSFFLNCTFYNNTAQYLFTGSNISQTRLINCIIYNNNISFIDSTGQILINYSDIEGGWIGEGNIDSNPLFNDPTNGDYTLQINSPCIDAGVSDTTLYFNGGLDSLIVPNMRYYGSGVDMGAMEYIPIEGIFGDINQDSVIDILDIVGLVQIILGFEEQTDYHLYYGDMNNDHTLDILDIVAIVNVLLFGEG